MNGFRKLVTPSLVFASMLVMVNPGSAVVTCHKINTKAIGHFTGANTTVSEFIGGGLLHGTTEAELNVTGIIAPDVISFDGTLVLTTKHGTLTLFVFDGVFDLTSGEFSADSVVIEGTGRFDEATGGLFFHGFSFPDGTFIDDEISGEICLDLP